MVIRPIREASAKSLDRYLKKRKMEVSQDYISGWFFKMLIYNLNLGCFATLINRQGPGTLMAFNFENVRNSFANSPSNGQIQLKQSNCCYCWSLVLKKEKIFYEDILKVEKYKLYF